MEEKPDPAALVERLRLYAIRRRAKGDNGASDRIEDAADLIESQAAEIAKLKDFTKRWKREAEMNDVEIAKGEETIENLTAEIAALKKRIAELEAK